MKSESHYLEHPIGRLAVRISLVRWSVWAFFHHSLWWWIAWKLPRRAALFAFVRVASASGDGPDRLTYDSMYNAWERGEGR